MTVEKKLNDDYCNYYFNRKELETCLGFNLDIEQLATIKHKIELTINLPEELKPFLSRKTIQLKEAANMMAGYSPFHWSNKSKYLDDVQGYRASLWDAVDNNILIGNNLITHEDFGQEWREDITLNKNEVARWARKYNYNWLLPIDEDIVEPVKDNIDLLQRIKQLEQDLEEQKKINDEYVEVPFYESQEAFFEAHKQGKISSSNANNEKLIAENTQLKNDNQKLIDQLDKAKKEIEKLNQFISSNDITELTEEYLKTRERNNHYSLIGGLLYLLLTNSRKNLNQTAIILSLLDKFKGEPFSKRHLEGIFPKAKIQLRSNHPEIEFD